MNPYLPVGGSALDLQLGAREALPENVTQVSLQATFARFSTQYAGSERVDRTLPGLRAALVQLQMRHHFGDGWSADVVVPTGTIRRGSTDTEPRQRLSGFGDVELGGEYDFAALWGPGGYRPSLTLRLALALPTGRSGVLGDEASGTAPSVLSLGNGAFGGVAELRLTQFVARRLALAPSVSVRGPFGANESGATMGTTATLGADALVIPNRWLLLVGGASLQLRGHTDEETEGRVENSGGRVVVATLIASVRASERVAVGLGGRVPVWTDVHGEQIAETYSLLALLSLTFGGDEHDEHEHGHGGDEHDAH